MSLMHSRCTGHVVAWLFVACVSVSACGGGGDSNQGATSNPPSAAPAITVVVSPSSAVVPVDRTLQFQVTVSNASDPALTWRVDSVPGGNATLGTISSAGLYTAPATVPTPDTVTITAISVQDPTKSASATVTIIALSSGVNDALLNGRYAFVFVGSEEAGFFVAGGTFVADGNGGISDGREDGNFGGGLFSEQPFSGSYSIGADRRGTMVIQNSSDAQCGCAPTLFTFKLNVVSSQLAQFIEFDGKGAGYGVIEKQDTATFSLSHLDGAIAFLVDGLDFNYRLSLAGRFSSSGGELSEGIVDINNQTTISPGQALNGTLVLGENGRGTATLGTVLGDLHFAYYIISSDRILLVGLDYFPVLAGEATRQTSLPFSMASLDGSYVFSMTAAEHSRPQRLVRADAGFLQADGAGRISDGVVDRSSSAGIVNGASLSGQYTLGPNGRGTAALSTGAGSENIVFYLTSGGGYVLQTDASTTTANNVSSGKLWRQDVQAFSVGSWQGQYGLTLRGSSSSPAPTYVSGLLHADGTGILETVQDIDDGLLNDGLSGNGTYSIEANGRGAATFAGAHSNVYLASDSLAVLIGTDSGQVRSGIALRQH